MGDTRRWQVIVFKHQKNHSDWLIWLQFSWILLKAPNTSSDNRNSGNFSLTQTFLRTFFLSLLHLNYLLFVWANHENKNYQKKHCPSMELFEASLQIIASDEPSEIFLHQIYLCHIFLGILNNFIQTLRRLCTDIVREDRHQTNYNIELHKCSFFQQGKLSVIFESYWCTWRMPKWNEATRGNFI